MQTKEQYGVKLETDLINRLEKIKYENGFKSRDELLAFLEETYSKTKKLSEEEHLDLSHYDEIEDDAKNAIKDGFELIVATIKQYSKKTKNAAHQLEIEKVSLSEERIGLESELKDIKISNTEEIKKISNEYKAELIKKDEDIIALKSEIRDISKEKETLKLSLETADKEAKNLISIAENTKLIIDENKQLKEDIKTLSSSYEDKLKEIKNSNSEIIDNLHLQTRELQEKNLALNETNGKNISDNRFNEKEINRLNTNIEYLKTEHQKKITAITKQYNDEKYLLKEEIFELKKYEKENIVLQTKLVIAYEENEKLQKNYIE